MKTNDKDIKKELEELAPNLNHLRKPALPEVPEQYFDQLPEKVWKKIQASETTSNTLKETRFRFFKSPLFAIAASLSLLIVAVFALKSTSSTDDNLLSEDEIFAYMLVHSEELDEDLFYSLLEEEDLTDINITANDDVIDYFLDNNIGEFDNSLLEDIF